MKVIRVHQGWGQRGLLDEWPDAPDEWPVPEKPKEAA